MDSKFVSAQEHIRVYIQHHPYHLEGFAVYLSLDPELQMDKTKRTMVTNLQLSEIDLNVIPEPAFRLDNDGATKMMDELWTLGVRPTRKPDDESDVIETMGKHISDLREIAFHVLKMNPKPKGENNVR